MIRARASTVWLLPLLGCAPTSPPARCPEPPAQAAAASASARTRAAPSEPAPVTTAGRSIGILPSTVEWRPAPPNLPQGAEVAVLEGDPRAAGLFTMRVRLPQGYVLEPHTHARDERVTVLDGSVHIGFGARAGATEKAAARRYVAGSYYVNPAGVAHFVFTTEPAVMQITTTGPWTLEYVAQP